MPVDISEMETQVIQCPFAEPPVPQAAQPQLRPPATPQQSLLPAPANRQDPLVVAAAQKDKLPAQVQDSSPLAKRKTPAETAKPGTCTATPKVSETLDDVFDAKASFD